MQQCKGCTYFDGRFRRWKCIKSHAKHILQFLLDMICLGLAGWYEYNCLRKRKITEYQDSCNSKDEEE